MHDIMLCILRNPEKKTPIRTNKLPKYITLRQCDFFPTIIQCNLIFTFNYFCQKQ